MTQPPMTPNYQNIPPQPVTGGGLALASLILGIVGVCLSLFLGCIPIIGPGIGSLLGILAVVLGLIAMSQSGPTSSGRGKAGLILGVIALFIAVGWHFAIRAGVNFARSKGSQIQQQLQQEVQKAQEEQRKAAAEQAEQMRKQQQNSTTQPSGRAPSALQGQLSYRIDAAHQRTIYLVPMGAT